MSDCLANHAMSIYFDVDGLVGACSTCLDLGWASGDVIDPSNNWYAHLPVLSTIYV